MNNKKNSTKTLFPIHAGASSEERECRINFFIAHLCGEETMKQTEHFAACVQHLCHLIQ